MLNSAEQDRLASNLAGHMVGAQEFLQKRAVANFAQADERLGKAIEAKLAVLREERLRSQL